MGSAGMKKMARMKMLLERLAKAPLCRSHDEAYRLLSQELNAIEDEYSGVPFEPEKWESDGRLYMPQRDNASLSPQHRGVIRYRSRSHWTFVADNGAFLIQEIPTNRVVLERPGEDGRLTAEFTIPRLKN